MLIVFLFLLLITLLTGPVFAFPGIPEGYPTPVSIPHGQSDWANTDYAQMYPEYGPIGSDVKEISWYKVNPSAGGYNWTAVEEYLDTASKQKVYLRSGEVISKPVSVCIGVYGTGEPPAGASWDMFKDLTPSWVYGGGHGHIVEDPSCGKTAVVPKYDSVNWRQAYYAMVRAFGEKFGDDPRLTAVSICSGIDGELIDTKNWAGCSFRGKINFGGHWREYVYKGAEIYRKVFPRKPIYHMGTFQGYGILPAGGYKGAFEYDLPIGYKINAMTPDSANHWAWVSDDVFQGTNLLMQKLYGKAPTAMESGPAHWQNGEYFAFLMGLSNHLGWTDTYRSWLDNKIVTSGFVADHLGKSIEDTPDVWIALRDTGYRLESDPKYWASSGKYGDYEYWLYRPENVRGNMKAYPEYKGGNEINQDIVGSRTVVVNGADLPGGQCWLDERPAESWKARRTDGVSGQNYMSFKVDDDYPAKKQNMSGYKVTVIYVDQNRNSSGGEDKFSIEYKKKGDGRVHSSVSVIKTKRVSSGSLCHKQEERIPAGEEDYSDWWQTHEFILPDAYFDNQMPGGTDFRIYNNEDGDDIIHMVKVTAGVNIQPEILSFDCDENSCSPQSAVVDISSLSSQENFSWSVINQTPWINVDRSSGQTLGRLAISINQDYFPGNFRQAYVGIHFGEVYRSITVKTNAPAGHLTPTPNPPTPSPVPGCTPCTNGADRSLGDANCDGKTDIDDMEMWRGQNLLSQPGGQPVDTWTADFTCNGYVDLADRKIWQDEYVLGLARGN